MAEISEKQRLANIQNSQLGGVKTPEGKSVSRYNAVTHGILRLSISDYEAGFYEYCLVDLLNDWNPNGLIETALVERIALCLLRLYRAAKADGEFMHEQLEPFIITRSDDSILEKLKHDVVITNYSGYKATIDSTALSLSNSSIIRYETTIENKLYKALHELQRLQAKRLGQPMIIPTAIDLIGKEED